MVNVGNNGYISQIVSDHCFLHSHLFGNTASSCVFPLLFAYTYRVVFTTDCLLYHKKYDLKRQEKNDIRKDRQGCFVYLDKPPRRLCLLSGVQGNCLCGIGLPGGVRYPEKGLRPASPGCPDLA